MFSASRRLEPTALPPRARARGHAVAAEFVRGLCGAITALFLGVLWIYRLIVSPVLHFVAGPTAGCRFHPTCSVYAAEALRVHGPFLGAWLALRRLAKCTPFHLGGVDFVPSPRPVRPRCDRVTPARLSFFRHG